SRPESPGFSPYYAGDSAVPPLDYEFPSCNDGTHNLACSVFSHLTGLCCPQATTPTFEMLGCCDVKNFLVDRTLATFIKTGTDPGGNPIPIYSYSNPTFTNIVSRWERWRARAYSCDASAPPPVTPALDAVGFCSMFQRTLDFVWDQFAVRGNCGGLA